MARYAMIRANIVENVVEWDGGNEWSPPSGMNARKIDGVTDTAGNRIGPGHTYADGVYIAPPPRTPQEPDGFGFTPREFLEALLTAMVQEKVILTADKARAIAIRTRNALKR